MAKSRFPRLPIRWSLNLIKESRQVLVIDSYLSAHRLGDEPLANLKIKKRISLIGFGISVVILCMLMYYLYNVYLNIIYFALALALMQFTRVNKPLNNQFYRFIKKKKNDEK
ncbi:MAG: hypothetical protein L0I47_11015 [Lactococcus lactis]|nr:hypothetical protein [Lactococcus lactis]